MSASQILQHLYSLDTSSPNLPRYLHRFIQRDEEEQYLSGLQGLELDRLVNFLDEALDVIPTTDDVYRQCLHKLQTVCGHHMTLPSSHNVSGDLAKVGDYPISVDGGTADVWEGTYGGRTVCIKCPRVSEEDLQSVTRSFFKEAVIWKRLRHPNIVPFIGVTRVPLQFVSEYLPNGTLTKYVKKNPSADRINLLLDVAEGLNYLHANHTIHGDLKGPNILVDRSGHARLTDFGLTSVIRGLGSSLVTKVKGYTEAWAAPEVLREGDKATPEADIFSFGMVVIEVFTGMYPFSGFTSTTIILKITNGERPTRPTDVYDLGLTDSVWDMTLRCWAQYPAHRPTVTEVVGILRKCNGLRTLNPPSSDPAPSVIQQGSGETPSSLSSEEVAAATTRPSLKDHSPSTSTSSAPTRSSSFSFHSRPSAIASSPPNKPQRTSMSIHQSPPPPYRPPQISTSQPQLQNNPLPPTPPPQQQPPPQPQQSHDQQPSPTYDAPLHPEVRSIVSLTMAHTQKIYFSGPLVHKLDRNPDGHKPHKDEGWREVWAQLYGTTLSIWDMEEVTIANQQGKEVPPSYVNTTEAFVHVLGAITLPATPTSPARKYTNVITLNTAGANLFLFSFPSIQDLISWATAFRLSCWEKSRLEEMYTAHLIRITSNYGRNAPSTLTHGRLEGWVRVRIAGQTVWKRLWMCLSAGAITTATRSSTDVASKSSMIPGNPRHSSYTTTKKNLISGLFSRDKPNDLPERATISLYSAPRGKDKRKALLTFDAVTQAFAVYPERPKLISSSALIKLEGTYGDEDMCASMKHREGWMLLMPDLEGARTVSGEMLKWLIAIHDAFELYGRPQMYSWDPRDPASMMFAYPIGPEKQRLFMDRELAEVLDPREERTSVVRSKLLDILVERMRGGPTPRVNQNGNGAPQPPPVGTGLSGQDQQRPGLGSDKSVPQVGVLSFEQARQQQQPQQPQPQKQQQRDDNWAQPPLHPSERRTLTPITERSTRDSGSLDAGSNPLLQRPGLYIVNGSPHSSQIQPQLSETSQESPKHQTDTDPPTTTILGEPLVTSPTPQRREEVAKETGASLVNVPTKPPPPQTGPIGAVSAHERERKREGDLGASLTARERDRRLAEERQRKLDDLQKQQLEMVQNGSMYGPQFGAGFNPMMANPMMMGMNPMMGGWGYNPMMGSSQQEMFAAQQAAAQAYQQAMMSFAQNIGQIQVEGEGAGGVGGGMGIGGMGSPGMLSPMATDQQGLNPMMTDPRMSMMGMPMVGIGTGMGPMNPMMTGQSGMSPGMGNGMSPGMGNGMSPEMGGGGGLAMQMTGGSAFDPRSSPSQLDLGGSMNPSPTQGLPSSPRPIDAPLPPRSPANASPGPK